MLGRLQPLRSPEIQALSAPGQMPSDPMPDTADGAEGTEASDEDWPRV